MKFKSLAPSFPLVLTALVSACAHNTLSNQLEFKLAQERETKSIEELSQSARDTIQKSPKLTDQQKSKLLELQKTTAMQSMALRQESLKLRSLLVKDLTQESYNRDEVDLIKERLKRVEERRLALIFGAVDKANLILGRNEETEKFIRAMDFEGQGHSRM